jgi:hypothetical protein
MLSFCPEVPGVLWATYYNTIISQITSKVNRLLVSNTSY